MTAPVWSNAFYLVGWLPFALAPFGSALVFGLAMTALAAASGWYHWKLEQWVPLDQLMELVAYGELRGVPVPRPPYPHRAADLDVAAMYGVLTAILLTGTMPPVFVGMCVLSWGIGGRAAQQLLGHRMEWYVAILAAPTALRLAIVNPWVLVAALLCAAVGVFFRRSESWVSDGHAWWHGFAAVAVTIAFGGLL